MICRPVQTFFGSAPCVDFPSAKLSMMTGGGAGVLTRYGTIAPAECETGRLTEYGAGALTGGEARAPTGCKKEVLTGHAAEQRNAGSNGCEIQGLTRYGAGALADCLITREHVEERGPIQVLGLAPYVELLSARLNTATGCGQRVLTEDGAELTEAGARVLTGHDLGNHPITASGVCPQPRR